MELHAQITGQGDVWIVLHGLFGSGSNWRPFGRSLADAYRFVIPDLCNHGHSPRARRFDYSSMAADVRDTLLPLGVEQVGLVGHSMGGKVAMQFAAAYPAMVRRLVVVDIAPRVYAPRHLGIIDALASLSLGAGLTRADLDRQLARHVPCPILRAFFLKSLVRDVRSGSDGWRWLLGLEEIRENYEQILAAPAMTGASWVPALFLRGGLSDFVTPEDETLIAERFPDAMIHTIPEAAHWVHTDAPAAFRAMVTSFMETVCSS